MNSICTLHNEKFAYYLVFLLCCRMAVRVHQRQWNRIKDTHLDIMEPRQKITCVLLSVMPVSACCFEERKKNTFSFFGEVGVEPHPLTDMSHVNIYSCVLVIFFPFSRCPKAPRTLTDLKEVISELAGAYRSNVFINS